MRRIGFVVSLVLLFALAFSTLVCADVLPRTTTATRDIILMEDYEDEFDKTAAVADESKPAEAGEAPKMPGMDGEEKSARLDIEEMHKADFALSLETGRSAEGDIYEIGDRIEFTFTSDKDCYVTLLDFTPSGKIYVLFPNRWVSDNFVKGGETITVPAPGQRFAMKLGGPAGVDVVKAIATNIDKRILDPENQKLIGPFSVLEDAKAATRDIVLFEEVAAEVEVEKPLEWAATSVAVFTKGDSPERGGFGLAMEDGWIVKAWADRDAFLTGEMIFVKVQSNRSATLVSLVNIGASGRENVLMPEGVEKSVLPGGITVFPGKEDKWKLIAASEPGLDVITALLRDEDGTEISVSFKIIVEE